MNEPDWLRGKALWAWRQLAEIMGDHGMKVLTRADRHALSLLCDAYGEYRDARKIVDKEGLVITVLTEMGPLPRKHPAVAIYQDAWRRVRAMLIEFGLTPAARSKVETSDETVDDPLQELINRRASNR